METSLPENTEEDSHISEEKEKDFMTDEEKIEVPSDLLERWQGVVDTLAKVTDAPAALIMKVEPPYIEVFRSSRTEGNPYEIGDREKVDGLYCEEVIESGDRLYVKDAMEDKEWEDNPDIELGMISYIGYPLNWPSGKPFGTICALDTKRRDYDEDTIELIEHFKELVEAQLAQLYENQKLNRKTEKLLETQHELRTTEKKLRQLHEAVDQFQKCQDEESLCKTATRVAQSTLSFDLCIFYRLEGGKLVPISATEESNLEELPSQDLAEGIVGKAFQQGQTMTSESPWQKKEVAFTGTDFKSYLSVPIGDLCLFQVASRDEEAFGDTEINLAEILAGHLREEIKRIRLEEGLRQQSIRDPLTDLYNRRYFNETLQKEVEKADRYHKPLAFLMIDVNRFKEINDRYSHQTGDEVLKEVAKLINENVRGADTVVRYGGDEFLIMMPETNEGSMIIADRLKEGLKRWNKNTDLLDFPLSLAIGCSYWKPEQDRDVEEALREADEKMYENKER